MESQIVGSFDEKLRCLFVPELLAGIVGEGTPWGRSGFARLEDHTCLSRQSLAERVERGDRYLREASKVFADLSSEWRVEASKENGLALGGETPGLLLGEDRLSRAGASVHELTPISGQCIKNAQLLIGPIKDLSRSRSDLILSGLTSNHLRSKSRGHRLHDIIRDVTRHLPIRHHPRHSFLDT